MSVVAAAFAFCELREVHGEKGRGREGEGQRDTDSETQMEKHVITFCERALARRKRALQSQGWHGQGTCPVYSIELSGDLST